MRIATGLTLALTLALAACGGGGTTSPATGGTDRFPTGTLLGTPFTPADGAALVLAPATCNVEGFDVGVSVLALGFTSTAGLCGRAAQLCTQQQANEEVLSMEIVRAGSGAQAAVGPGTYPILAPGATPAPDANGELAFALGTLGKFDAQCQDQAGGVTLDGGTVTLTSVSATRAAGTLQATLSDGSTFGGAFDVAICTATLDTCAVVTGTCGAGATCHL